MPPFVYSSTHNAQSQSNTAVIVLPEIFGLKTQIKEFADELGKKYGILSFALDFFYILTATTNDFDYSTGIAQGVELMQKITASDFDTIFDRALDAIKHDNPHITKFIVVGFCFGGSLALYSGTNHNVSEVVCFYPGQALKPQFDGLNNIAELVAQKRETILPVKFLFGSEDGSISEENRAEISSLLTTNPQVKVEARVYHAGHAFMNSDRSTHNAEVTDEAWLFIDQIFTHYSS